MDLLTSNELLPASTSMGEARPHRAPLLTVADAFTPMSWLSSSQNALVSGQSSTGRQRLPIGYTPLGPSKKQQVHAGEFGSYHWMVCVSFSLSTMAGDEPPRDGSYVSNGPLHQFLPPPKEIPTFSIQSPPHSALWDPRRHITASIAPPAIAFFSQLGHQEAGAD